MIKKGSKVKIHYTLKVEGEVVDSTSGQDPLDFEHGIGELIPGFEENLEGLKAGETKKFEVEPDKGYGQHNPNAVEKIPLQVFKNPEQLGPGERITGQIGGQTFHATVLEVGDNDVTVDLNHPLAGKTLDFEVEVVAVE